MKTLRKNLQVVATVMGLGLLGSAALAAWASEWGLAGGMLAGLLAVMLVLLAHMHQRVGNTMRVVVRAHKQAETVRARLEREEREVREQRARDQSRVMAQFDAMDEMIRAVARDMSETLGRLDERGRMTLDELARYSHQLDDRWSTDVVAMRKDLAVVRKVAHDTRRLVRPLRYEPVTEIDAMLQLHRRFPMDGGVPLMWEWALSPRALLQTVELALSPHCRTVVECGSGTSTIYLGRAMRDRPGVRLVSLEHTTAFADVVQRQVEAHDLQDVVEVRVAPLQDVAVGGNSHRWYAPDAIDDLTGVDLLLVDGPPRTTGPLARFPAFPMFRSRLADGAVVALDDATRDGEKEILDLWTDDEPELCPMFSITKNLALLRWRERMEGPRH